MIFQGDEKLKEAIKIFEPEFINYLIGVNNKISIKSHGWQQRGSDFLNGQILFIFEIGGSRMSLKFNKMDILDYEKWSKADKDSFLENSYKRL